MTAKRALVFAAFVTLVLGVILTAVPNLEVKLLDVSDEGDIYVFLRRYGILFLTLAIVFGLASRWPASPQRRDVLIAGFFAGVAFTVSTVVATATDTFNSQGWGMAALEAFLAAWFGFLVVTGKE